MGCGEGGVVWFLTQLLKGKVNYPLNLKVGCQATALENMEQSESTLLVLAVALCSPYLKHGFYI